MKKRIISIVLILCFSTALFATTADVIIDDTILEPRDPILATVIAIGPGFLAHGWGQFYSEEYRIGLMLFGLEVISLVSIGVGYVEYTSPSSFTEIGGNEDEVRRAGLTAIFAGIALFTATWLADILMAGQSAKQYNIEHNLEFKIEMESNLNYTPALMYAYKF